MKYLRKFTTQSAYNTAKSGSEFWYPSVSLIDATSELKYDGEAPAPAHPYVEIGGIKWATMNVGATSPEETGLYFQWGDTQGYTASQVGSGSGQKAFAWADYKFNPSGDEETMTKYNATDGKTVLDLSDDAVNAAYGGNWRMPTTAELQALGAAVNTAWTSDYQSTGVAGLVCTDKTDSSKVLFFPAAGYCEDGSVGGVGSYGSYWSSSLDTDDVPYAFGLNFRNGDASWDSHGYRYCGCVVRGVLAS